LRRLIVNADDFGLAETVNLGIVRGHREGIVTSTTLLACGVAAEDAARLALENPSLGVGIHLCLTREAPVLDPADIPSIARGDSFFASPLPLMARLAAGLIKKTEIEAELRAQVEKAISLGVRPTHIDGHQHVHVMPVIFDIAVRIAKDYGIKAMRYPVGPSVGRMGVVRSIEKLLLEGIAKGRRWPEGAVVLSRPDNFFGLAETGCLGREALIRNIKALPEGTSEIMCHPGLKDDALAAGTGWGHGWQGELDAVTDAGVKALVADMGVELVCYNSI